MSHIIDISKGYKLTTKELAIHKKVYTDHQKAINPVYQEGGSYRRTIIVDVKDIEPVEYGVQEYRSSSNPEYKNLRKSLGAGLDLSREPIAVTKSKNPNYKYKLVRGVSRETIKTYEFGLTNLIVEVHDFSKRSDIDGVTNDQRGEIERLIKGASSNVNLDVRGTQTESDLEVTMRNVIRAGHMTWKERKEEYNGNQGKWESWFVKSLTPLIKQANPVIQDHDVHKLLHRLKNDLVDEPEVISFQNKTVWQQWLNTHQYNNGPMHYFVSFQPKNPPNMLKTMHDELACSRDYTRVIYGVIHLEYVDGCNPVEFWLKNAIINALPKYAEYIEKSQQEGATFSPRPEEQKKVKLFGIIPQVKALQQYFPMDRLIVIEDEIAKHGSLDAFVKFCQSIVDNHKIKQSNEALGKLFEIVDDEDCNQENWSRVEEYKAPEDDYFQNRVKQEKNAKHNYVK